MEQAINKISAYVFLKLTIIFIFILALLFTGCSKYGTNEKNSEAYNDGYKTFVFYDKEDGKVDKWKVVFQDDEIYRLYKNDTRIDDNEIDEYEDMVYDNLPGSNDQKLIISGSDDSDDSDDFNFKFKWDNDKFDKKEFRKQMQELKKQLKKLKNQKFNFHFDSDAFNHEMEKLGDELNSMDMDEFNEKMEEFSRKMKEKQFAFKDLDINIPEIHIPEINIDIPEIPDIPEINIDIPEIHVNMDQFHRDMESFGRDMEHFDSGMENFEKNMDKFEKEMKKLDAFLKDFKAELVKEKVIKNEKDEINIQYDSGVLRINGEKASDNLQKKYKELYKLHFGKEPEGQSHYNY